MDAEDEKKTEVVLKGKRCNLRPPRNDDQASISANGNDSKVFAGTSDNFPHPYTKDDACKYIKRSEETRAENGVWHDLVIEVDGKAVGGVLVMFSNDLIEDNTKCEIGYWLGHAYWGKGIATEALKLLIPYVWENFPDVKEMIALMYSWNKASARVCEKNGFKFSKDLKGWAMKGDKLEDGMLYTLARK